MPPSSRLWVVRSVRAERAIDALAERLAARALAALAAPPRDSGAERLARALGLSATAEPGLALDGELALLAFARSAAAHPTRELVLWTAPSALRCVLSSVLGLAPRALPVELRPGAVFAFDWPVGGLEQPPPVLLGADLDWLPPWRPDADGSAYPGGPGGAGTARA